MQGPLLSHCASRACCQFHLLKVTQIDSEPYLQEMQEDSDNKATSLDQNYKHIDKVASCFHCLVPRTSDDMFDVDNIEGTDLEEVSKILTNMCQEKVDILNIKGCLPRRCIMHYFPIIPTCARLFLTNKDESFDHDLTSQLSEIIKTNNLVRILSLRV